MYKAPGQSVQGGQGTLPPRRPIAAGMAVAAAPLVDFSLTHDLDISQPPSAATWQGLSVVPRRPLSPREREILDLVRGGHTQKEVAYGLGLSDATVRVLYARAMRKLGRPKRPLAARRLNQRTASPPPRSDSPPAR